VNSAVGSTELCNNCLHCHVGKQCYVPD